MTGIRLLGPVEVVRADGMVVTGPPQQSLVLAALALDVGREVTMDRLVARVWADEPPDGARRSLHVHISRIRRHLPVGAVRRSSGGYVLDLPAEDVDVHQVRLV